MHRVAPTAGISIGNGNDNPSKHRPELALLAMSVIGEFSILESFMDSLFISMLGVDVKIGLAMYSSLVGAATKKAAFSAVAKSALTEEELAVFTRISAQFGQVAKQRHRIAHWIWGHSEQIPAGVLLCDSSKLAEYNAAMANYLKARSTGSNDIPPPELHEIVFVYYEHDFLNILSDVQRVRMAVANLRMLLLQPSETRAPLLNRLSALLDGGK